MKLARRVGLMNWLPHRLYGVIFRTFTIKYRSRSTRQALAVRLSSHLHYVNEVFRTESIGKNNQFNGLQKQIPFALLATRCTNSDKLTLIAIINAFTALQTKLPTTKSVNTQQQNPLTTKISKTENPLRQNLSVAEPSPSPVIGNIVFVRGFFAEGFFLVRFVVKDFIMQVVWFVVKSFVGGRFFVGVSRRGLNCISFYRKKL